MVCSVHGLLNNRAAILSLRVALKRLIIISMAALLCALPAWASVVDATKAEAAYRVGDYKTALKLFREAADKFRDTSTDSEEPATYREAAYIYDRLADCCFTQRDWEGLKHYTDGLLVVSVSERNLCETRLQGALESGISRASAKHLADELDEAVQLSTIYQYKRSLALVLFETQGGGSRAERAIALFQQLAGASLGVIVERGGLYRLDEAALRRNEPQLGEVFDAIETLDDLDALWDRNPPGGKPISGTPETTE